MKPSTAPDRSGGHRGQNRISHPAAEVKPRAGSPARSIGTGGTEAAARVADVLALFTTGAAALGVSEIARELGLGKAVVHRILQSLASRSFVVADPRTRAYRLGPGAVALGARALRDLDLRQVARPALSALRDQTRETTTLSAAFGRSRVYLDQYESPQEITMKVELGRPYPLYAGASSRAILAFLPESTQESIIAAGLIPLTPQTIGTAEVLRRKLAETRATGYATSRGERQDGAGSVAAAVFGMDGEVAGAISVCGPVSRFESASVERFVPLALRAAGEISRSLGWTGAAPWSAA